MLPQRSRAPSWRFATNFGKQVNDLVRNFRSDSLSATKRRCAIPDRRPPPSREITRALGRIKHGLQKKLYLGNLDAKRDWGYAGDYVDVMWRMLQHESPEAFVVATGETHAVSEFLDEAFGYAGLDWRDAA